MEKVIKQKQNLSKGITLIALVITIIVLLILAAISIATLTGDNGILTKATEAKRKTEEASAKERIQVEVLGSIGNDGNIDINELKKNIRDHISEATISGDTFPITVTVDGQTFIIEKNGNIEETKDITTETITAKEIASNSEIFKKVIGGKVLNYGTDSEIEWKVFYADDSGIYLIASDYVPVSKLTTQKENLGFLDNSKYNIYWDSSNPDFKVVNIDESIANKFMLNEKSKFTTNNNNYKMTACLLDTTSWETFRDERWADENNVIGGPTLEMYVSSWNKKHPENKLYTNTNSIGYYVGSRENPTTYNVGMSSYALQDELYYPHLDIWNNCYGYWLVSPSAYDGGVGEMCVDYIGGVYAYIYYNSKLGVRPLVHLKSNVKVKLQGENFVLE